MLRYFDTVNFILKFLNLIILDEAKNMSLKPTVHSMGIHLTETVVRRCSVKKMFLETSQNSQENTCARVSFLIRLQA